MSNVPVGMTTYPSVADAYLAGPTTLEGWLNYLPSPQTDVERTVYARIMQRFMKTRPLAEQEQFNTIHNKLNDLKERLEAITGKKCEGWIDYQPEETTDANHTDS